MEEEMSETTIKMTRAQRRRYKKGERPADPMDRLILGIAYAINDNLSLTNLTDIAQAIVAKAGSIERAIQAVESGELTYQNMGPVGEEFRYMTFDQIAAGSGMSSEQAAKTFDELEEKGLLIVEKRDDHGALFAINYGYYDQPPQVH
jgi:hypothetical protein